MHWQERERAYLSELCREREIEIEVLGIVRDDYSVPEYKDAMRAKDAAEAEIEILQSEKLETETYMATLDSKIEQGHGEIAEQEKELVKIPEKLFETMLDKYEAVGTVENIIEDYEKKISSRDTKIDKLTKRVNALNKKVNSLNDKLKQYADFIREKGFTNLFELFLKPKSAKANLEMKKEIVKDYDEQKKNKVEQIQGKKKEHGIAI